MVIREKGVLKPCIVIAYENKNPISLLVGNIREKHLKLKLGYKSLLKIKCRYLEIMYGGILGDKSPLVSKGIVNFLKNILPNENIDYIFFKALDINSNMYKAAKKYGGKICVSRYELANPHIFINIPESYKKFLENQTKKRRHEVRRYSNRFEKEFNGKFVIKLYRDLKDIDIILKDTFEIASKTYQHKLGVSVRDNKDTRKRFQFELEKKRLLVWIMYIERKPVAFWTFINYKGTMLASQTGYLQGYNKYRPGLYLFFKIIDYFCINDEVNKLDFGFGDAQYKRELAHSTIIESNVSIYSFNSKGLLINSIGIFNGISLNMYRKLSKRFEMIRKIKKKSRDSLLNN